MTHLHKAIGDLHVLAICTDACKGLEKAVKMCFLMLNIESVLGILCRISLRSLGVMFFQRCILQLEHIELKYLNISSNLLERLAIK